LVFSDGRSDEYTANVIAENMYAQCDIEGRQYTLNDLDIKMADIKKSYWIATISQKVWTVLGQEFGDDAGKRALIVRSLCGLKSAGAEFRNQISEWMKHLG
jgi:hypothetical protein